MAVLVGILFIILGLWGITHWFQDFLAVVRGFIPVSLVVGGIVALSAGVTTFRPRHKNDKHKK